MSISSQPVAFVPSSCIMWFCKSQDEAAAHGRNPRTRHTIASSMQHQSNPYFVVGKDAVDLCLRSLQAAGRSTKHVGHALMLLAVTTRGTAVQHSCETCTAHSHAGVGISTAAVACSSHITCSSPSTRWSKSTNKLPCRAACCFAWRTMVMILEVQTTRD